MIFPAVEGALYCAEEHSKQSTLSRGREDTFLHFLKTVFLPLYSLPSQTRIYRHRSPEQLLGLISEWKVALALFFFFKSMFGVYSRETILWQLHFFSFALGRVGI